MKNQQAGFTLIELIAVIVILGVLAATAVPRFVDLSAAADEAAIEGIAGGLSSASALNHAANIAVQAGITTGTAPIAQANCTDASNLLQPAGLPDGYTITGAVLTAGVGSTCTLNRTTPALTAEFAAYGVGP